MQKLSKFHSTYSTVGANKSNGDTYSTVGAKKSNGEDTKKSTTFNEEENNAKDSNHSNQLSKSSHNNLSESITKMFNELNKQS